MKKEFFQILPKWLQSNRFFRAKLTNDSGAEDAGFNKEMTEVPPLDANLISSEKANGKHILMLDLDQASYVFESSSHGHKHVYIDTDLDLGALKEIVDVLVKHSVLQPGIKKQLDAAGCLTLRPPGVKKTSDEDQAGIEEYKQLKKPEDNIFLSKIETSIKDSFKWPQWKGIGWTEQPAVYTEKGNLDLSAFKNTLTGKGKASKHYEAEHAIKRGVYVMPVPYGDLGHFLAALSLKLGVDPIKIEAVSSPSYGSTLEMEDIGYIRYHGQKIANLHFNVSSMNYMVEFRKDFIYFEGHDKGGVPEGWPEWDYLVKVTSQL